MWLWCPGLAPLILALAWGTPEEQDGAHIWMVPTAGWCPHLDGVDPLWAESRGGSEAIQKRAGGESDTKAAKELLCS